MGDTAPRLVSMWIIDSIGPDASGATKVAGTKCTDLSVVASGTVILKLDPLQVTSVTRNGSLPRTTICPMVFWPNSTTPRNSALGLAKTPL